MATEALTLTLTLILTLTLRTLRITPTLTLTLTLHHHPHHHIQTSGQNALDGRGGGTAHGVVVGREIQQYDEGNEVGGLLQRSGPRCPNGRVD